MLSIRDIFEIKNKSNKKTALKTNFEVSINKKIDKSHNSKFHDDLGDLAIKSWLLSYLGILFVTIGFIVYIANFLSPTIWVGIVMFISALLGLIYGKRSMEIGRMIVNSGQKGTKRLLAVFSEMRALFAICAALGLLVILLTILFP